MRFRIHSGAWSIIGRPHSSTPSNLIFHRSQNIPNSHTKIHLNSNSNKDAIGVHICKVNGAATVTLPRLLSKRKTFTLFTCASRLSSFACACSRVHSSHVCAKHDPRLNQDELSVKLWKLRVCDSLKKRRPWTAKRTTGSAPPWPRTTSALKFSTLSSTMSSWIPPSTRLRYTFVIICFRMRYSLAFQRQFQSFDSWVCQNNPYRSSL